MGCFVNFGADWLGPGQHPVRQPRRGRGRRDRRRDPRAHAAMHALLRIFEPDAVLTDNIWGYLWGKLAYGAMLFATALTNDSMTENFADPRRFRRVRPARPRGDRGRRGARRHAGRLQGVRPGGLRARRRRATRRAPRSRRSPNTTSHTAKTHSGIWRDLAVRKRKTEVDQQIGIIADARRARSASRRRRSTAWSR